MLMFEGPEGPRLLKGSDLGTFVSMGNMPNDMCELCPEPDNIDTAASCEVGSPLSNDPEGVDPEVKQSLAPELTDLSEAGQTKLRSIFASYSDVFSKRPGDIGQTNLARHKIDT